MLDDADVTRTSYDVSGSRLTRGMADVEVVVSFCTDDCVHCTVYASDSSKESHDIFTENADFSSNCRDIDARR